MSYSPLDLMGVVVQWSSSVLLLLLFYRLGWFGARRQLLRTWMAAWAAQVISITGFALHSLGYLVGRPLPSGGVLAALDALFVPGKLVFVALVAVGAMEAAGKTVRSSLVRVVVLGAGALGLVAVVVHSSTLSGVLQIAATVIVCFGGAVVVSRAARRRNGPRLPFLALALVLFGAVTTIYMLGGYFAQSLGRFGELVNVIANSSGYGDGLVSAVLGFAVIVLIIDDAFDAANRARGDRVRDLAASEARLTGVLEAAREAIVTVDRGGRIDLANAMAERRFGLARGGALGRPLGDFVLLGAGVLDAIQASLATSSDPQRNSATINGEGRRADGSLFPLELTLGLFQVGGASGTVAIIRDLTSQRAAEADREAFERRMAESEKMLAIGRVVSGVAHELNNPLAVVLGQSEYLVDAAMDDEVRDGLRLIAEQAHRARHIVRDLLAFVRRRDEPREEADIARLIQRVVAAQHGSAAAHGVAIAVSAVEGLPPVRADSVAIEQVLVNLIDNGLDAAGPGGTVRIGLHRAAAGLEVSVEDSGAGVRDDLVPRIFEPFFTTKPMGEGTGLGLAVCLGVAERHGGSLRLENRPAPGIGARFVLFLPVIADHAAIAPAPVARTTTLPKPPLRADGTPGEVLVIDDEAAVRSTLARIFRRGGWSVREMATGEEALSWLVSVPAAAGPALILCDLKMPGMGGRDVHAHLKAERPEFLGRLVFVTGDVVEASTAAFIAATSCHVVEKPFTVAEIARAVEQALEAPA